MRPYKETRYKQETNEYITTHRDVACSVRENIKKKIIPTASGW